MWKNLVSKERGLAPWLRGVLAAIVLSPVIVAAFHVHDPCDSAAIGGSQPSYVIDANPYRGSMPPPVTTSPYAVPDTSATVYII